MLRLRLKTNKYKRCRQITMKQLRSLSNLYENQRLDKMKTKLDGFRMKTSTSAVNLNQLKICLEKPKLKVNNFRSRWVILKLCTIKH